MSESDVIDRAALDALMEMVGGDQEFFDEMIETFFEDSAQLLALAQTALAAGDAPEVRRAAHSLKSNSASFGAMALSQHCRALEDLAKTGTLGGTTAMVEKIQAEYARAERALRAIQAGG
jgi:HPt (histidine-containing phosphotransfer) domain-containing protein